MIRNYLPRTDIGNSQTCGKEMLKTKEWDGQEVEGRYQIHSRCVNKYLGAICGMKLIFWLC